MGFFNTVEKRYVVHQVALTEKMFSARSGNLYEIEDLINKQAAQGYRLHSFSTTSTPSKGFSDDREVVLATMVFEKI